MRRLLYARGETITYCYTNKAGKTREETFLMGKAPKSIRFPDGTRAHRDIVAEHSGFQNTPGTWPQASYSLAVNSGQREEAIKKLAALGCPTDYNKRGQPVFRSNGHKNAWMNAVGAGDADAGYGQRAPSKG